MPKPVTSRPPILIVAGTNRPGSNALRVARILKAKYDALSVPADVYPLTDLPAALFAPSAYAEKPREFLPVQQRVLDAAGVHLVVPEYNGGFPGVLKYFIDMLKFPESFEGKPVAFVGEAAGQFGALRAVEQLQQVFAYRNAYLLPQRVFMPGIQSLLSEDGTKVTNEAIDGKLTEQVAAFADFVRRLSA
ncbi:MAG: NADPH-dependent FMN reductase [Phycisphaerae bacterium]